jgi:hypothetical protein
MHDIMAHLYKIAVGHEVQMGRDIDITANKIMAADMYLRYARHEAITITPIEKAVATYEVGITPPIEKAIATGEPSAMSVEEINRKLQDITWVDNEVVTFGGTIE